MVTKNQIGIIFEYRVAQFFQKRFKASISCTLFKKEGGQQRFLIAKRFDIHL